MTTDSPAAVEERARRIHKLAQLAAERWPLEVERIEPIKVRENAVFAVHTISGDRVAMRVHRHGYHSDEALLSEGTWTQALHTVGIEVPRLIQSTAGRSFELVDAPGVCGPRQVDVFEWIEGEQLGSVKQGIGSNSRSVAEIYRTIGVLAARMHNRFAEWQPPAAFHRHAWDCGGLLGERPLWGRFWEYERLSPAQRKVFIELRNRAFDDLRTLGCERDCYGLIHADLVGENILVHGDRLRIIDFDDCGFGWHLFELATSLYFIMGQPYFHEARDALLGGYREHRVLSAKHARLLALFLAIRGTTYLGWMHTRQGEPAASEIAPYLIELAENAANAYLSSR